MPAGFRSPGRPSRTARLPHLAARAERPGRPALAATLRVWITRATPSFTNRTSFTVPSWFVLLRRTAISTPSPSAALSTSAQRSALTSLRRIPLIMKRSPRDERRRGGRGQGQPPRTRGRVGEAGGEDAGQVRAPNGRAWPRPRSTAVPGPSVPRPGSARGRGGPGSTPQPPWSRRSPTPGPSRWSRTSSGHPSGRVSRRRSSPEYARWVFRLTEASTSRRGSRGRALECGRAGRGDGAGHCPRTHQRRLCVTR